MSDLREHLNIAMSNEITNAASTAAIKCNATQKYLEEMHGSPHYVKQDIIEKLEIEKRNEIKKMIFDITKIIEKVTATEQKNSLSEDVVLDLTKANNDVVALDLTTGACRITPKSSNTAAITARNLLYSPNNNAPAQPQLQTQVYKTSRGIEIPVIKKKILFKYQNNAKKSKKIKKKHSLNNGKDTTKKSSKIDGNETYSDQVLKNVTEAGDYAIIGPNFTTIPKSRLESINWSLTAPSVTRKVLMEVFDRKTLATHTLTGKQSPAFLDCNKPNKYVLDPAKVYDVVHFMQKVYNLSAKDVRSAITTKCADENKMLRSREMREAERTTIEY